MTRLPLLWRHAVLAGVAAGLLASPALDAPPGWLACVVVGGGSAAWLGRGLLAAAERASAAAGVAWLLLLLALGALLGAGLGDARLAAIGDRALPGPVDARVRLTGYVVGVPRRSAGEVRVPLETAAGRVLLVASEPVAELPTGAEVRARGVLNRPEGPYETSEVERAGSSLELQAGSLELTGGARGGIDGALDRVRLRAEDALAEGLNGAQSALARGFVLGEDDLVDPATRDDFKRAGLSHLLAVSGQNVMLLAILGGIAFGLCGAGFRTRLALTLILIAAYVPVAGAGPSILRAGVMGAAGLLATLAGRPADRFYPMLVAAAVTLLINPRFGSDAGWQLSFAALLGIMLWARPLRDLMVAPLRRGLPDRIAAPIADGAGLTLAATLVTAPLIAHTFERVSIAALPANLGVLPAIAPVMWLGMLISLLGQLPQVSIAGVEPLALLGWVEGRLIDYVAWVARVFANPDWAQVALPLPRDWQVVASYAGLLALMTAALEVARRRRGLRVALAVSLPFACTVLIALLSGVLGSPGSPPKPAPGHLRITELDVGQGDAILLQAGRGAPVLVDAGPPGGAAGEALRGLGVDRLRALFVTHADLDHAGGVAGVAAAATIGTLVDARPAPEAEAITSAQGGRVVRTAAGRRFEFGRLELDVLWPPRDQLASPSEDRNFDSIVLVARFGGYSVMLSGDAEQEVTGLYPGPLDVLKVAHHGSDDAGLADLLARSVPRVALISVGADNTYGHPTEGTLSALAERGVCTLRTDLDGAATVEIGPGGLRTWTARGPPPAERPGCGAGG